MLNELKKIGPEKAERTLAALVKYLTPQPSEIDTPLEPLEATVLDEIMHHARVPKGELTKDSIAKLLDVIAKEMSKSVLESTRTLGAKTRLGMRGDLRADLYQINFGDKFKEDEKRGIRRKHVEQAIHTPDKYEHLLPNRITDTDADMPNLSLYAKTIGSLGERDAFTLLVQTHRQGYKQLVCSAWRVYHSDVDLSRASSVLDMLKAFVGVYGMDFYIGDRVPRKFLLYEVFSILQPKQPLKLLNVTNPNNDSFESSFMIRISPLGAIEVGIAYVINTARYCNDLRKHNVQIAPDTK